MTRNYADRWFVIAITVLIADDSAFMRRMLEKILLPEKGFKIIGAAKTGVECITKLITLNPKVVVLDIMLPDVSGLNIVYQIMRAKPTPVLLFSSLTENQVKNDSRVFDYGIVDFVNKPGKEMEMDPMEYLNKLMVPKLSILSKLRVEKFMKIIRMTNQSYLEDDKGVVQSQTKVKPSSQPTRLPSVNRMVVIGASTGGPQMVASLVKNFPKNFPPVLIVQHIPVGFIENFVKRVDNQSRVGVYVAEEGMEIRSGNVYFAPGGRHMEIRKSGKSYQLKLTDGPMVNFVKPSVDVTLTSVVKEFTGKVVAVILTGMGKDGTEGCRLISKAGGKVLALNEEDSVVYGMNRSVIESGYVDHIYSIDDMLKGIKVALGL